jgi:hypothetical protein
MMSLKFLTQINSLDGMALAKARSLYINKIKDHYISQYNI